MGKIFSVLGVCLKATWKSGGGHMNIKCVGFKHIEMEMEENILKTK